MRPQYIYALSIFCAYCSAAAAEPYRIIPPDKSTLQLEVEEETKYKGISRKKTQKEEQGPGRPGDDEGRPIKKSNKN